MKDLKSFVLKWNNTWQYDFWWREKYNISFNSSEHQSANQIDIKLDYLEKRIAQKQQDELEEQKKRELEYIKEGKWLRKNEEQVKKEEKKLEKLSLSSILGKK